MDSFLRQMINRKVTRKSKLIGLNIDFKGVIIMLLVLIGITGNCQKSSIYFKFNDYGLDKRAKITIDSLIKNKSIEKIYLKGHCDSTGSNEYNDALSLKRVGELKKYLLSKDILAEKVEIKALGKRAPLNKNMTEKERALNRRVEIEIISKINPSLEVEVLIKGIVEDEKKQPLKAEISLSDKNGKEIQSTLSGKDGKYSIKAIINKKEDYSLTYYNDSSFIGSENINYSKPGQIYNNLKTMLPKLKVGNKYKLQNLNFYGDTSQLVAASLSSLEALYKLMKKNKSLVIRIEGHVNRPLYIKDDDNKIATSGLHRYVPTGMKNYQFYQWLSEERAKTVYNYLVEKGIETKRLSIIGYGATKMLYPNAKIEYEMAQNRRVEINVISYK